MLVAVNFHYIRESYDAPYPAIYGVSPSEFRKQLELLAQVGKFVGIQDLLDAVRGKRPLPERCWLITFDDGLTEQFEHALPVLKEMGIPAAFFVNTESIESGCLALVHKIHLVRANVAPDRLTQHMETRAEELGIKLPEVDRVAAVSRYKYDTPKVARLKFMLNSSLAQGDRERLVTACFEELLSWDEYETASELYMSPDQLTALSELSMLGTHGHSHLALGTLAAPEISEQIDRSLRLLNRWTGTDVKAISYPYGTPDACTAVVGTIAATAGIEFGVTMERAGNPDVNTPLYLARCACNDLPGGSAPQWALDKVFEEIPHASWHRDRNVSQNRL